MCSGFLPVRLRGVAIPRLEDAAGRAIDSAPIAGLTMGGDEIQASNVVEDLESGELD